LTVPLSPVIGLDPVLVTSTVPETVLPGNTSPIIGGGATETPMDAR